jgi:apolipoprotein N-acyltransferase
MVYFSKLSTIKNKLIGKPFLSVFLLGLLSSLSFAPTNNLITLSCGFLGFLWFFEQSADTLKRSFLLFFLYMFGYYAGSFYWVALAIIALGQWYLMPFGLVVHAFLLSTPSCLIVPILYKSKKCQTLYPFIVAFCFFINEWLIGHFWFGGFPWALTAYAWNEWGMQLAAYVGVYGASLITLIWLALLYKPNRLKCIAALIMFMFICVFGHVRYMQTPIMYTDTIVRIVHPNISQKNKLNQHNLYQNFYCHKDLSHKQSSVPVDLIVWPEAVIFVPANQHQGWLDALKAIAPDHGYAIIGAPRLERTYNNDPTVYTSAYILNQHNVIDIYDKMHLVPFGEYLPWRPLLSRLGADKLTEGALDFTSGKERALYKLDNIPPFSILICYEVLFPGEVLNTIGDDKPEWLLNMTNDAWYLNSSGPYQHLHIARWRAVEEGMPIIRCTNKGISCVIDSVGRVLKSLGNDVQGVLDVKLPKPIKDRTFYSEHRWFL